MNPNNQHDGATHMDEPATPTQRRTDALRRAATSKREAATARAETAIRQLVKNQQDINFRSVARTGGVSLDFLYANTELRRRIETLRAQQATSPAPPAKHTLDDSDGNIVHVLTVKLRDERATRRTAVHDLEQRLAATHGELLRLRRVMQQHGIHA
jgi:Family of unknown function (DUF6262)